MPEFILDHGSSEGARTFNSLDAFTQGYIEAIFFTNTGSGDDGDLEDATVADLAAETLAKCIHDCELFQRDNAEALACAEACRADLAEEYDMHRAGVDFWFTRNHHGAGFWDRGLGEFGDTLTTAAHGYVARDLYRGDDGLVYLS